MQPCATCCWLTLGARRCPTETRQCDGATDHSSKSARDIDRLRDEVLNRLGWDLYRIWSTDWFRDPLGCREVLKSYLAERLQQLLNAIPKIAQPKLTEPKSVEPSALKTVKKIVSERNSIRANIGSATPNSAEVKVGSRVGDVVSFPVGDVESWVDVIDVKND